ncbi:response regulator [Vibrio mexicanus]|uniref:response regulator n=1 Tax=Vibrio mexicanus TaxID=1004326 RepID=UPI00063C9547|nr:response regulator [Vibrio mexicanus]
MYKSHTVASVPSTPTAVTEKLILVVDDDPIFRRITRSCLEAKGYSVIEAEDGLDGLRQLRTAEPDMILCDLNMPILGGLEFVEEISLEYPSLPLIVVSATDEMSDVAQALRFGIKDFLPKPISNPKHLLEAVENTLDDSSDHLCDQRDFASQWFRVDGGDVPEEQELHWHLEYLQENPNAARDLLHALLPDKDTSQGAWKCSYRLLQSADTMPLVFDYAWLMNGQFAFYLVDSASEETGVATTLLVRALFHDYLRNLKSFNADLKDIAYVLEKGIACSSSAGPIRALFGVVDMTQGTISLLPAGLDARWSNSQTTQHIEAENMLGEQIGKNFIMKDLPIDSSCQLMLNRIGSSSFSLEIYQSQHM